MLKHAIDTDDSRAARAAKFCGEGGWLVCGQPMCRLLSGSMSGSDMFDATWTYAMQFCVCCLTQHMDGWLTVSCIRVAV